jgi:hypothetical protein
MYTFAETVHEEVSDMGRASFSHWEKVPAERADEGLQGLGVIYLETPGMDAHRRITLSCQYRNPSSVALRAPPSPKGRRSSHPYLGRYASRSAATWDGR